MKYAKTWISIDDQVKLLTKEKGLCCSNVDELKRALEVIGYYRLSAYWFPYKTTSGDGKTLFCEGATFDEVMRTYELDRRLRLLIATKCRPVISMRKRRSAMQSQESFSFQLHY